MEKAHKMQEKKKSISGRKTDKTGKPAIWQLRGRGFYAGNEKEEKNLQSVILDMVNRFGYLGILILIAVENVFPPIPSEVILTFGGFLTTCTRLHPAGVVLASTAGSLLGALVLYGAGTLVSPEGLAELLESRPMKLLGFRAEDAWKTIAWFQKKGAAGCAARPMHSDHPKSHLGSGRHGGDEDAGISAIYHSREYGLESSSGWHRRSGRRCMGAGGRICEAICGCGFPYFNGGNRMLSGITFI